MLTPLTPAIVASSAQTQTRLRFGSGAYPTQLLAPPRLPTKPYSATLLEQCELPAGGLPLKGVKPPATLFMKALQLGLDAMPDPLLAFYRQIGLQTTGHKSLYHSGLTQSPGAQGVALQSSNTIAIGEEYYPLVHNTFTDDFALALHHEVSVRPPMAVGQKAAQWKPWRFAPHPQKTLGNLRDTKLGLESLVGHETGHHLDRWAGSQFNLAMLSDSPHFHDAALQDMDHFRAEQATMVRPWLDARELFTETTIEMMGLPGCQRMDCHPDVPVKALYPRTENWIYRVLQQLHMLPNRRSI